MPTDTNEIVNQENEVNEAPAVEETPQVSEPTVEAAQEETQPQTEDF